MVLYPFVASLTLDASSGNVVGGATGSVFAKADTTFTTPLAAVDASGNPVTLTSNANGVLPSFYVDGHTSVNWVSGEWVFPLVTSEPVEGPEGPAGVSVNGATATGDDLVFSLSNGSITPPVKLPTAPGGSDAGVASYITTPGTETATALSATYLELSSPIESVPFSVFGDSYGHGDQGASQESRPFNRLAVRHRTKQLVVNAVAGTRMDQIATKIKDTWTPNTYGLVGISDGCINDMFHYVDDKGLTTTREAFRGALTYLTSRAVSGITSTALSFGTGWSSGASSTVGSFVNIAFTGTTANLMVMCTSGTGGTLEVRDSGGVLLKTITTGGYQNTFPGSVALTGGTGTNQYKVTLTAGSATIYGVAIPSATPPLIVWDKPGQFRNNTTEWNLLQSYLAEAQTVANTFPAVLTVGPGTSWDYTTMISQDSIHRNDRGNRYVADTIDAALRAEIAGTESQGLNRLTQPAAAAAYVHPTATAASTVTTYAADTFTRADSTTLGSTETGAFAWVKNVASSTWDIISNALRVTGTVTTENDCYIDDAQANGTLAVKRAGNSFNTGMVFRASGVGNVNGYIFWITSGGVWTLSKRTASNSYTSLGTSSAVAAAAGQVMSVVLNGTSIICKVDGQTLITVTDASYTGTRHGVWANSGSGMTWDDFTHTDAI